MEIKIVRETLSLYDSQVTEPSFRNASLVEARFDDVNLQRASFHNANLAGATFVDVNLANASISNANTTGMRINEVLVDDLLAAYASREGRR